MKRSHTAFGFLLPVVRVAGAPGIAADLRGPSGEAPGEQGAIEAWVGCWALDHREDWAPNVNPEIRSLATARRVACPEGKAPHTTQVRDDLVEFLGEGVEATFAFADEEEPDEMRERLDGILAVLLDDA
jgi:hypothetical protein